MGKKLNKILITGGAGFIGSNLAVNLQSKGYEITILDNFLPQIHGNNKSLPPELANVNLINGDVTDRDVFYNALRSQDAVIHYAAETGTGQSMYSISHYTNVNIQATSILCDYIVNEDHELKTVIVASSRSIYGEGKYYSPEYGNVYPQARSHESMENNGFEPCCPISGRYDLELLATDEDSRIHPSSFYGITKQVQEQMVILACKLRKISGFALRYQNVYGPGQSLKNPYTGILSIFSRLALEQKEINVFEDGLESRDFVYIDDVIDATTKCLEKEEAGQYVLNVGSGVPVSVKTVANEIVSYLKSSSIIRISGAFREGDIRHNFADLSLVEKTIGFVPKWQFRDGLHRFLDWVLAQKDIPASTEDYDKSLIELKERGLLNE
ncbi:NAD-dependent epimerase/dehydratase family protein [Pedobacter sp. JY14-1]|uniref:NAD-dependent epimerase/dehydratase family protein n=1 Tax=Pedobacter sp. JY14-1 TaxID=3034151 RepID=UPI0023E12D92|nr:NAD-dependent epimerase/dehydratase family protein [Pedobacter sp. JY14-1]